MDDTTEALSRAIGATVRRERRARQWTLDQLAAATGLSRRAVVNVEQGTTNPSVGTLLRLSEALGIGLPDLVEMPSAAPIEVVRGGDGAVLWTGEHGGRGVLVAGVATPDVLELWEWTLAPGDRHTSDPHVAGTRELVQVRRGTLVLEVGETEVDLGVGDAASFAGDLAHSYANASRAATTFSLVVSEPAGAGVVRPAASDGRVR